MLRRTRGLNERRVSFRGGGGAHNAVLRRWEAPREAVRVEGRRWRRKQLGEAWSGRRRAREKGDDGSGKRRRRLGEGAEWTRGRPVKLLAGGNRKTVECKSRVEALR